MRRIASDHPCLRRDINEIVADANTCLPEHLAREVHEIYKQARFSIWKIFRDDWRRRELARLKKI